MTDLSNHKPGNEALIPGYKCIVKDKDLLGGQAAILGTRISVVHILECLAGGMMFDEISREYGVPYNAFVEALNYAADTLGGDRM